jgi:glycosyltransferase involved in cell wall biosynthesis
MSSRLGVDVHRLVGARTGVARYVNALLAEWARMDLPFSEVVLYAPAPIPEEALPRDHPFTVKIRPPTGPRAAWAHWDLARAADSADVLFCPSYVCPLTYRGHAVVTVHDAAQENVPGSFSWRGRYPRWLYRRSARRADLVLTDSHSAREDLLRAYRLPPERVRAVPLGVNGRLGSSEAQGEDVVRERYGLDERPIVLFVGKLSRRRNVPMLARAFATARQTQEEDWTLVLAGPNHLDLPLEKLGRELSLGDSLRPLGFIPDNDLAALYRAADIFVLPSDYEGTSLTVLEAMAAATAVITGGHSGLKEVAGDAALLLDTMSEGRLVEALATLMRDPARRRVLAYSGQERARTFSWKHTATETMAALAEVARVPA